jgi:Flp pilus assembly protein TadG
MRPISPRTNRITRRGAAVAELALLLPFLALMFAATLDYTRVFFAASIVQEAARCGALYGSASTSNSTNTSGIQTAAQAGASDLSPLPSVSSSTGTDANSNATVTVTVTWTFTTFMNYPALPSSVTLTRTVTMRIAS